MTFGPSHYVPVLKVKRGEKQALSSIGPAMQPNITPLLEIVARTGDKGSSVDKHLDTAFKNLADCVRPYSRCFLDAREIASDGPRAAEEVFRRAAALGISFTPVTGISRSADTAAVLSHMAKGVALRLTRNDLEAGGLTEKLRRFLARHGLAAEKTDLILDLGPVDDLVPEGISALTRAFLLAVPDHREWRTFTLSGCAFPRSMGGVGRNSHAMIERAEWSAWRDNLYARRTALARLPTFSDCAIQHPEGVEGFDPRTMAVSASIRYAVQDAWLLIKGESTRITPPSVQFPALAKRLVYGDLRTHFAGESHCEGCAAMKRAADGAPKLGSAEVWRRLGTIHHIVVVMRTLASSLSS